MLRRLAHDVWPVCIQCMLKLRRSARPKTNCTRADVWTRPDLLVGVLSRVQYSRLSPPAGLAPALYGLMRTTCKCEISGLGQPRDKRSFRGVSLGHLAMDVLFNFEIGAREGLQSKENIAKALLQRP